MTDSVEIPAARYRSLLRDEQRLDWLADPHQAIGQVSLPTACVHNNLHSLRAAIDAAMELIENQPIEQSAAPIFADTSIAHEIDSQSALPEIVEATPETAQ